MTKEHVEWLRVEAHKLVHLARKLNGDHETASQLEALAIEMLSRALELEKANRF